MQIGHWFFKSCRIFVAVALCQRETFLCHSLWQRANTWSIMFENLQGGQFNYVINSVDSTKLPCYTLPQTQHHSFTLIYSYILFIIKLFQNNFINLFFQIFFFCNWCSNLWSGPWSDPIWSRFCQGVTILINPQPQLFLHEHVSYNCC